MKWIAAIALLLPLAVIYSVTADAGAKDNELTENEKKDGWIVAFDGKTLNGWKAVDATNGKTFPSRRPIVDGTLNPHKSGGYMVYYDKPIGDCVMSLDFKLGQPPEDDSCNSPSPRASAPFARGSRLHVFKGRGGPPSAPEDWRPNASVPERKHE